MTTEINNISKQARQGSVAAIIQILNEKLADSGVRTRAIFADGVLQLLCEAPTLDQLEQPVLVERIRSILEEIAPRNIRRVNVNSRIVREQQLLWLEEINRDRANQVLWAEEITLKQSNLFQQLMTDWASRSSDASKLDLAKASPKASPQRQRENRQFWRGLAGGALVSCSLLALGWFLYQRYGSDLAGIEPTAESAASSTVQNSASLSAQTAIAAAKADPFANAVRIAERSSRASQTATSAAEWLDLAAAWQRASDLMAQVAATDARYPTAQGRVTSYRNNSAIALQKARQVQSIQPASSTTFEPSVNSPDSSTGQL